MKFCLKNRRSKQLGFSLVEVMVAVLILTIVAMGGAALMQRAGSTVAIQKNKRAAITAATRRLEQLRTEPYENLDGGKKDEWYIRGPFKDGSFGVVSKKPTQTISINGVKRPIYVKAKKVKKKTPSREFIRAIVYVQYRSEEWVSLATNLR